MNSNHLSGTKNSSCVSSSKDPLTPECTLSSCYTVCTWCWQCCYATGRRIPPCCVALLLGRHCKRLLTPHRKWMSDQSTIPPKSTQVSHWVLLELLTEIWVRGYLQKLKCPKDSCHQKSHPSMGDNSQNLETWISGHSLQESQRVGEGSFQETTSLFFSPQFILSPLPPGNLAGLNHSESLSSPLLLMRA